MKVGWVSSMWMIFGWKTLGFCDLDRKEMDFRRAEDAAPLVTLPAAPDEDVDCNCIFSFLVVCF
jgi:hypothetical protein